LGIGGDRFQFLPVETGKEPRSSAFIGGSIRTAFTRGSAIEKALAIPGGLFYA
jgi:hypothetical protein